MRKLLPLAILAPIVAFADWPAGSEIQPSMYVDVTPAGFQAVEGVLQSVLPTEVVVDTIEDRTSIGGFFIGATIEYGVRNVRITPAIDRVAIVPSVDRLDLAIDAVVAINSPSNPAEAFFNIRPSFFGISLGRIRQNCRFHVNPRLFPIATGLDVGIERDNFGRPVFDAEGALVLQVSVDPITEFEIDQWIGSFRTRDLNLRGCFIGSIVNFLADIGLDFVETIFEDFKPVILDALNDALFGIEDAVDGIMQNLVINESFDVQDVTLDVSLFPDDLRVMPDGLRISFTGAMDSGPAHSCIRRFDDGLSRQTIPPNNPRYPFIGQGPRGFRGHHAGAMINDDLMNQALYAVWRGGLLCQTIMEGESPIDLPIPLTTSLLDLLASQQFREFFPTAGPMIIRTRPEREPWLEVEGRRLLDIKVRDLGLDFYAELDGRFVRVFGMNLDADAGVDVNFDSTQGLISALIDFDPADIDGLVIYNDLKPAANPQIESGFNNLAQTLVAPLLGDLLGDIGFAVPTIYGLGLQSAVVAGVGPIEDFLGFFALVGEVDYIYDPNAGGCGDGCGDDEGCGEGCDALGPDGCLPADPDEGCEIGLEDGCDDGGGGVGLGCTVGRGSFRVVALSMTLMLMITRRRRDPA